MRYYVTVVSNDGPSLYLYDGTSSNRAEEFLQNTSNIIVYSRGSCRVEFKTAQCMGSKQYDGGELQ
jgi:hypothetical protein